MFVFIFFFFFNFASKLPYFADFELFHLIPSYIHKVLLFLVSKFLELVILNAKNVNIDMARRFHLNIIPLPLTRVGILFLIIRLQQRNLCFMDHVTHILQNVTWTTLGKYL